MQVCPDRNSANQPEAADDGISVSLSQVTNGSVKSRAVAQEASWAFSHVAANKRHFLWFSSSFICMPITEQQQSLLTCKFTTFLSCFTVFICSRQNNCSFFVAYLISACTKATFWRCRGVWSSITFKLCCFSNLFLKKAPSLNPRLYFKYNVTHVCALPLLCLIVWLSLPAQYMGFRQLSESNNRLRQSGGSGRVCLRV